MKGRMTKISLQDIAVIYYSQEDECWIAHSVYTDQVGLGNTHIKAFSELIRLVDKLLAMASADDSIEYLRKAPDEVLEILKQSKPYPFEWSEVAHNVARGAETSESEEVEDPSEEKAYTAPLCEAV